MTTPETIIGFDQPAGAPIHILLVEDNPGDVMLIREAFAHSGFNVVIDAVEDGEEAIAFLRGRYHGVTRPHIILLDLNLPRKNGCEVLAEIKGDAGLRCIPVIILTTSRDEADVIRSYTLGANSYVSKPINVADFLACIKCLGDFWVNFASMPHSVATVPPSS